MKTTPYITLVIFYLLQSAFASNDYKCVANRVEILNNKDDMFYSYGNICLFADFRVILPMNNECIIFDIGSTSESSIAENFFDLIGNLECCLEDLINSLTDYTSEKEDLVYQNFKKLRLAQRQLRNEIGIVTSRV